MKTTQVIGLFVGSQKTNKILHSLTIAGIHPESVVSQDIDVNVFATNVSVKDEFENQMVRNILEFYNPSKLYDVNHPVLSSELKTYIEARSKAEIYESPEIRKRPFNPGINSEVHFG